ncbi:ibr finger domain [Fusarium longipes]|uniref:Ibr finger domain n=1 Tax=Fusarium longipes TaxID=694270 RepID=A0A395RHT8_9HYPO|nr:ibr finger domain [Fusarium longipes]
MNDSSLLLALQLQQQDLDRWERTMKGKQREGDVTDVELAFKACRHELEVMTTRISDHMLALSIARAVESDGQAIREAQLAEEQAVRDREYALMLMKDPSARPVTVDVHAEEDSMDDADDDLIDILRSLNLGGMQGAMSGQPESSTWASSRMDSQTRECIACNEKFPPLALSKSPCSHEYCRDCLVGLVSSSLHDESLFPPKCCGKNIPVTSGRWFSPTLVGQFQAKKLEYDTPNRTYCYKPSCSTFIPPVFIAGEHHKGICPDDTASQQVLQLASQNGWQQCYACNRVVELETGCYHMTCYCRAQFCYVCGDRWKRCSCPQWDENRLIRRANVVVDRDDHGMNAAVRHARVEAERLNLMENHGCAHDLWRKREGRHRLSEYMEVTGLVIGVVGLVGLFKTVLEAWDFVDSARDHAESFKYFRTRLDNQRAIFLIWAERMGFSSPGTYNKDLDHPPFRARQIRNTFWEMQKLFSDVDNLVRLYGLDVRYADTRMNAGPIAIASFSSFTDAVFTSRYKKARAIVQENYQGQGPLESVQQPESPSLWKKTKWSVHDEKKADGFIAKIEALINDLERLTQDIKASKTREEFATEMVAAVTTNSDFVEAFHSTWQPPVTAPERDQ